MYLVYIINNKHYERNIYDLNVNEIPGIKLRPHATDNAGGLGKIGKIALHIDLLLLPPMILLSIYIFLHGANTLIVMALLIFNPLCLFLFFYPMKNAHYIMKKAKQIELKILSDEYNLTYDKFRSLISQKGFNMDEEANQLYESLTRLQDLTLTCKNIPEWPFNTKTLITFSGTILLPFIFLILESIN